MIRRTSKRAFRSRDTSLSWSYISSERHVVLSANEVVPQVSWDSPQILIAYRRLLEVYRLGMPLCNLRNKNVVRRTEHGTVTMRTMLDAMRSPL